MCKKKYKKKKGDWNPPRDKYTDGRDTTIFHEENPYYRIIKKIMKGK